MQVWILARLYWCHWMQYGQWYLEPGAKVILNIAIMVVSAVQRLLGLPPRTSENQEGHHSDEVRYITPVSRLLMLMLGSVWYIISLTWFISVLMFISCTVAVCSSGICRARRYIMYRHSTPPPKLTKTPLPLVAQSHQVNIFSCLPLVTGQVCREPIICSKTVRYAQERPLIPWTRSPSAICLWRIWLWSAVLKRVKQGIPL